MGAAAAGEVFGVKGHHSASPGEALKGLKGRCDGTGCDFRATLCWGCLLVPGEGVSL